MSNDIKLNLYYIDNNYINYLQNIENTHRGFTIVPNSISNDYHHLKPYVGIILQINDIKYFAPLTHSKKHYQEKIHHFKRVSHGIQTNNEILGRIIFCYMIPAKDNVLKKINISDITEPKYQRLLNKQYFYLQNINNVKTIIFQAKNLYSKVRNNQNHYLAYYCCNFALLEQEYQKYPT